MKTPEDEAWEEMERKQGGGGFPAKRQMAADKLQDETDMLTIAYLHGYDKGKKAALAQPAQEPVAWLEPEWGEKICPEVGYEATITDDHPRDLCWIPLYTAPPQPAPWPPSSVITPEYLAEQENKNKKMRALLDDDDDIQDYRKPWRGLTDEQRLMALKFIDPKTARLPPGFKQFAEAIEKLLKDQNT